MIEFRCTKCEAVLEIADECYECQIFLSKGGVINDDVCPKGHPFTPENTIMQKQRFKFRRVCKECQRGYYRSYWDRRGSEVRKQRYAESKQGQG